MLIGQSVIAPTSPGAVYRTPWFPRQSDTFTAVVEMIRTSGGLITVSCQIQTKNNEGSDADIVDLGSPFTVSTTAGAVTTSTESEALEQVRLAFTVVGSSRGWIHFRTNAPIWQPN